MEKTTNPIYSVKHTSWMDRIVHTKRTAMCRLIAKHVPIHRMGSLLDIGTTSDGEFESSNCMVHYFRNIGTIKSISDQPIDAPIFKQTLCKDITSEFSDQEVNDFRCDLVISSATIEHVGSAHRQQQMIRNLLKLTDRYLVLTTPNRFHPIEFHTKLPFLHWIRKKDHRRILKKLGLSDYSLEENLNLLSKNDLSRMFQGEQFTSISIKTIRFLGWVSNFIVIVEK